MSEAHVDLTGIYNQNEYFTNHYFASSYYDDDAVKALLSHWQEEQQDGTRKKSPWAMLGDAGRRYYAAHEKYNRSRFNQGHLSLIRQMADVYLHALGYDEDTEEGEMEIPVADTVTAPVYRAVKKSNGSPLLWIILAASVDEADESILSANPVFTKHIADQNMSAVTTDVLPQVMNEELVNQVFFGNRTEHPRFVMLIGIDQIILLDRNKWGEKKYFSFDLPTIFGRHEQTTLKSMAVLLHKDSLCPAEGKPLLDTLDAASYRNANAVSDDLKYALRESIELLGNEVLYYYRTHDDAEYKADDIDAADLSIQCVRYMYRLLFLFFMESRPELGYAPVKENTYLSAYSIESLRSIAEKVRPEDMVGDNYYFSDTLSTLFDMIYNGYPGNDRDLRKCEEDKSSHDIFVIHPLKAHIFDRERTPLLYHARLRDEVMIRIINLMSLTRDRENKKQRRGRISYANLGINQIGSVYEALLSYRGFIAKEKLYEVKRAGDKVNELDVGYFVPENQVENYDEEERVYYVSESGNKKLRTYEKGTFIYRLAGREREQSASYYTPESLTKCLVKYALKELLKNKKADDILHLKICEPAMGSAAFLNEAINQLAEAYINKKQEELGDTISYAQRARELQKVKMYIADENVYGVDLNPTAVELAEVSLWLNTIYSGGYVPWFRTQLVNGNSLIGARRECYRIPEIVRVNNESSAAAKARLWYHHAPERIIPGKRRDTGDQIYHFLLGDPGMASYTDKVIKGLEKENIDRIKKWNKEFTSPYSMDEIGNLLNLSRLVDKLWESQVRLRRKIDELTKDHLAIYPEKDRTVEQRHTIREKDAIFEKYYLSAHEKDAGAYARLKFAMDYWCALWFWPITKADLLPTKADFINDMYLILEGTIRSKGNFDFGRNYVPTSLFEKNPAAGSTEFLYEDSLFHGEQVKNREDEELEALLPESGEVDLDRLCQLIPRLALVREIADKNKFLYWELEFADVFAEKGGFDLFLGNPPWVKVQWNEQNVLSDSHPMLAVRKISAAQAAKERDIALANDKTYKSYLSEYESSAGQQNFLNAVENYEILQGQQTNLYKCFLPQAWKYNNKRGCAAFVHPDGVYDDPKGALLRKALYPRLRYHFMFINEKKLFFEVHHNTTFSLNVYASKRSNGARFDSISNLYDPSTIDECYGPVSRGQVPGIKDEMGDWNIKGHSHRILHVTEKELAVFAGLFDDTDDWSYARLPVIHARELMEALKKIYQSHVKLRNMRSNISISVMWDETNDQKKGNIKRDVHFPETSEDTILSGPHIGVANPLFKCSRRKCVLNSDYDNVDLTTVDDTYRRRCNYSAACSMEEYRNKIPQTLWGTPFNSDYMIASRKMLSISGERTLIPAIIPPKVAYIHAILGMTFQNQSISPIEGVMASIPIDFYLKATGKQNGGFDTLGVVPVVEDSWFSKEISTRALMLNCLTVYYANLWEREMQGSAVGWAKEDHRLAPLRFSSTTKEWKRENTLRTDYERREALVELDVLTAMSLQMTLEELKAIYRIQFPVLQSYEKDTWYDANGRIVFTPNRGLTNVGFSRKEWENGIKGAPAGKKFYREIQDDTMPGGPKKRTIEYVAPFDRCDREKDYETVWKFFEEKYGKRDKK